MSEHADQPVRPAATVIIVRDADPQFEIFMLRRTSDAAFAGGMYVFPGGRVDEEDLSSRYAEYLRGPSSEQAGQRLALGGDWQGFWVAGIRETFEEAGIMLACHADGSIIEYRRDADRELYQAYRLALHAGEITLAEICAREKLTLALDLIHFYNRWITPAGRPRRFDTRFFITAAPSVQTGLHDGSETVDSLWISPDQALSRNKKGEFGLMAVTEKQLQSFAAYRSAADFIAMARSNTDFPTFRPAMPPAS